MQVKKCETAWNYLAAGFGTAAKLAAKGFAGAVVGGIKLTTQVILPSAAQGISEVVSSNRSDRNQTEGKCGE